MYPDVQGNERLLRYPCTQAGCCKVLLHPLWGSRNYPGTLFSLAPPADLMAMIQELKDEEDEKEEEGSVQSENISSHVTNKVG